MTYNKIGKLLIVETRVVGFFSNVNVIFTALQRLSKIGFKGENVYVQWNNPLYQDDNANLFERYFFKNGDKSDLTHTINAIDIGLPSGFFVDDNDDARNIINDILKSNLYFDSELYNNYKNTSVVKGRVLGVHIRGTDHTMHGQLLDIDFIMKKIDMDLDENYANIFVATDEEKNIKLLKNRYGDKLIYNQQITRSGDGTAIHFAGHKNKQKLANDVMLDCISLSLCSKIIMTASNVSGFALALNTNLIYHQIDRHLDYR